MKLDFVAIEYYRWSNKIDNRYMCVLILTFYCNTKFKYWVPYHKWYYLEGINMYLKELMSCMSENDC